MAVHRNVESTLVEVKGTLGEGKNLLAELTEEIALIQEIPNLKKQLDEILTAVKS
jgi:hypothetical protein